MHLELRHHVVELSDIILQLNDEALWARNENDVNVDKFAVVFQLALFELNDWIIGTSRKLKALKIAQQIEIEFSHPKLLSSVPRVVANWSLILIMTLSSLCLM